MNRLTAFCVAVLEESILEPLRIAEWEQLATPGSVCDSKPVGVFKLLGLGDRLLCFNPDCPSNAHHVACGKWPNFSEAVSSSVTW